MFSKTYGNVTICTKTMPKRGLCLHISKEDGEYILADICGMNPALVPDGTNAYYFGNKLIIVTRWSDMSDDEKTAVEKSELVIALHPLQCAQLSLKIDGKWSDVMTNLPHVCTAFNDKDSLVDEIIFIFSDTHNSSYITERSVTPPKYFQKLLKKINENSISFYSIDDKMELIRLTAENTPDKDEFDFIYDLCFEETKQFLRTARAANPDNIRDGIYVTISPENEITDIRQHEYVEEVKMSDEVKMYLTLAENGIAEGAYNLGVCYEQGDGVAQDFAQAIYWYKKAAEKGHAKAQHNLGVCVYNGYGTEADHEKAAELFLLSAEQGDMYAQYNIAVLLMNGDGIEKDIFKAIDYLKKAADAGHPQAKAYVDQFGL